MLITFLANVHTRIPRALLIIPLVFLPQICRQLSTLQSAHWQQLPTTEHGPCRRASHSLLVAEEKLVTIAGGCDGGEPSHCGRQNTCILDASHLGLQYRPDRLQRQLVLFLTGVS